jgi:ppGpp synthetase/RelA/SpoT-type nucleotidyltranferase
MSGLSKSSREFLKSYEVIYPDAVKAAAIARELVSQALNQTGVFIHTVSARAKSLESMRGKLRRKSYSNPAKQMTDIVGVRVITYYRDAVDPVVRMLKQAFEIDGKLSTDKRLALGLRDFGYRSVHLIARVKQANARNNSFLRDFQFEIQVRSILEHAWAEIEHEIVYKSGVRLEDEALRRFAALAGSLEIFDGEFLALREQRNELIENYVARYKSKLDQHKPFDVARLLAFLETKFPDGRSWRTATSDGSPFASGLEVSCVEALRAAGLVTAASLKTTLTTSKFRSATKSFASLSGISPAQVSHLAIIVLAVAVKDLNVVRLHFPERMFDCKHPLWTAGVPGCAWSANHPCERQASPGQRDRQR